MTSKKLYDYLEQIAPEIKKHKELSYPKTYNECKISGVYILFLIALKDFYQLAYKGNRNKIIDIRNLLLTHPDLDIYFGKCTGDKYLIHKYYDLLDENAYDKDIDINKTYNRLAGSAFLRLKDSWKQNCIAMFAVENLDEFTALYLETCLIMWFQNSEHSKQMRNTNLSVASLEGQAIDETLISLIMENATEQYRHGHKQIYTNELERKNFEDLDVVIFCNYGEEFCSSGYKLRENDVKEAKTEYERIKSNKLTAIQEAEQLVELDSKFNKSVLRTINIRVSSIAVHTEIRKLILIKHHDILKQIFYVLVDYSQWSYGDLQVKSYVPAWIYKEMSYFLAELDDESHEDYASHAHFLNYLNNYYSELSYLTIVIAMTMVYTEYVDYNDDRTVNRNGVPPNFLLDEQLDIISFAYPQRDRTGYARSVQQHCTFVCPTNNNIPESGLKRKKKKPKAKKCGVFGRYFVIGSYQIINGKAKLALAKLFDNGNLPNVKKTYNFGHIEPSKCFTGDLKTYKILSTTLSIYDYNVATKFRDFIDLVDFAKYGRKKNLKQVEEEINAMKKERIEKKKEEEKRENVSNENRFQLIEKSIDDLRMIVAQMSIKLDSLFDGSSAGTEHEGETASSLSTITKEFAPKPKKQRFEQQEFKARLEEAVSEEAVSEETGIATGKADAAKKKLGLRMVGPGLKIAKHFDQYKADSNNFHLDNTVWLVDDTMEIFIGIVNEQFSEKYDMYSVFGSQNVEWFMERTQKNDLQIIFEPIAYENNKTGVKLKR